MARPVETARERRMPASNPLDGRPVGTLPASDVFGQPGLAALRGVIAGLRASASSTCTQLPGAAA